MNRAAVLACVLLAGCSALDPAEASTTPAPTLGPLATATIPGQPAVTELQVTPMPSVAEVTTTTVPQLARETEVALRRCAMAIDNDFLPVTLRDRNIELANEAVTTCNEATVQLEVEPTSDFVDYMLQQVAGARSAIGLASLSRRMTDDEAKALGSNLNSYVARINLRLDEIPELP